MILLPHGAKIGNATVIVDIISKRNPKIRPGHKMNPTRITDHDTGNASRGANAEMHNRYIHNMASYNPRDTLHVSWHLTVDENFIYQHIPFDESAWHCGDGSTVKSGNRTSIGVEKCMDAGGDRARTENNAIALHVYLLKNVIQKTPSNVVPHQYWSGKYCPAVILKRDGSFNPYRSRIQSAFNGATVITPTPNTKDTLYTVKKGDTLSAIASNHKTTVAKIQKDNNIKNANFIYPGQVLKVGSQKAPTKPASSKPKANLKIDGFEGPETIKAEQRYWGTPVDSFISKPSLMIKKRQAMLGVRQDGYDGPDTIRAEQRRYGTPVDGVKSKPSMMIKERQRRLNKGKL